MLFLEIKQETITKDFARRLLRLVQSSGFAKQGRPCFIRRIGDSMPTVREVLAEKEFSEFAPHIRLHQLFTQNGDLAERYQAIRLAKEAGLQGVEFDLYGRKWPQIYPARNLYPQIFYARHLGLQVGLFTIRQDTSRHGIFDEVLAAAFREEVDFLTVDAPITQVRRVVTDKTSLLYLNVWNQNGKNQSVRYFRDSPKPFKAPLAAATSPTLVGTLDPPAKDKPFGYFLKFDATKRQALTTYDADNSDKQGYLVTTAVRFDQLTIPDATTACLVAKSDRSGFTLELHNPGGILPTQLRFGVHVDGRFQYATLPISRLNTHDTFFLIGAYDGQGDVWLWIDNSIVDLHPGRGREGVKQNNLPVLLGADPQGTTKHRHYFSGSLQQVMVQRWGSH